MNKEQIIELKIERPAYGGRSIGQLDGFVYFVNNTLPGETVRARVTKIRKNCGEADLEEILEKAPSRITPTCGLAALCEGCCYQHMEYKAEVALKQELLLNLLEHMGKNPNVNCVETFPSPSPLEYRNKITMHIAHDETDTVSLGYFGKDNQSVLDIPRCPLAVTPLNDLLHETRNNKTLISSLPHGSSVTFRWTKHDGAMRWTSEHGPCIQYLTESTPLGNLTVPAESFFQVNTQAASILIDCVGKLVKMLAPETVIDLYCGTGVFALAAGMAGVNSVLGTDSDETAIEAAQRNACLLNLANVKFRSGLVSDLLTDILSAGDAAKTTVILDPARKGLEKSVINILIDRQPANIIYISCAPDTMARDIKLLTTNGYEIINTRIIDMFPRTQYFESVTHLTCSFSL